MQTPHLSVWSWYWGAWILAFLIPEVYWVIVKPLYTLSDTVWALEGLNFSDSLDFPMWSDVHWAVAVIVWLLFAWLSIHIPFGWLR